MRKILKWALPAVLLGAGLAYASPTILGNVWRLHNIAVASFPAASALFEGGMLYDTTNDAPYFATAAAWINLEHPTSLASVYVNAVTTASTIYGGQTLPARAFTVNAVAFRVRTAGSGGTTNAVIRVTDGSNSCDASWACNTAAGNQRLTPSGTCAFAASSALTFTVNTIGDCSAGPDIFGNVEIIGSWR
jgi:hypothetical protein